VQSDPSQHCPNDPDERLKHSEPGDRQTANVVVVGAGVVVEEEEHVNPPIFGS